MASRGRKQEPKKVSAPAHPKANYIIVANIDGFEYRTYVTHVELIYYEKLDREGVAWKMKFSYLISKKREKGLIAGWERKPSEPFVFEILPANPNKYQQHQTYKGRARFNSVVEDAGSTPRKASFILDIIGSKVV